MRWPANSVPAANSTSLSICGSGDRAQPRAGIRLFRLLMVPINVPNVLTVLRILAVPVLVVALLDRTPNGDLLAAVVFAIASLTDAVDGYLARSPQWVTTFGKLMD